MWWDEGQTGLQSWPTSCRASCLDLEDDSFQGKKPKALSPSILSSETLLALNSSRLDNGFIVEWLSNPHAQSPLMRTLSCPFSGFGLWGRELKLDMGLLKREVPYLWIVLRNIVLVPHYLVYGLYWESV